MKKKEDTNNEKNIEKLTNVIKEKTKIPKELSKKITDIIYQNVVFGVIIVIYLGGLNLGILNIPTENYLVDLRVFSIVLLVATIILFEMSYKKESGTLWIHGIEVMCIRIIYNIPYIFIFNIL